MQSVTCTIFDKERKSVLLIQRRDVPVWVLPGGGIEAGETPQEAILREAKEETGFEVEIVRKVGEYIPINKLSRFTYLFECRVVKGEATISDESKAVTFFPLKDLPKLIPPPYPEWIKDGYLNSPFLIKRELTSVNYFTLVKNFILHPTLVIRFLLARMGLTINT